MKKEISSDRIFNYCIDQQQQKVERRLEFIKKSSSKTICCSNRNDLNKKGKNKMALQFDVGVARVNIWNHMKKR